MSFTPGMLPSISVRSASCCLRLPVSLFDWAWLEFLLLVVHVYDTPTQPLGWWEGGGKEVLGGRDGLAGGTWLGATKDGKLAFLTNFREPDPSPAKKSRGDLPVRFLESTKSPYAFAEEIVSEAAQYNGFNLVLIDLCLKSMIYISNGPKGEPISVQVVPPGLHVLSNANLNSPWPKLSIELLAEAFGTVATMYGSRGAFLGSGGLSDGYEGTKRPRMMESNPYFAVSGGVPTDGYEVGSKRSRMLDSSPYFSMGGGIGSSYQPFSSSSFGSGFGGSLHPLPVVRLRGLPFNCEDIDIIKFFMDLDIVDCLLVNKNGRFTGEAFVVLASPMQAEFALQRDKQHMGRRYIEVFRCNKQDYYHAVAAEVNYGGGSFDADYSRHTPPAPTPNSARPKKSYEDKDKLEYTSVLKLRGLPYSVTKSDIIEFFEKFDLNENKVHIGYRLDGKATGEAFAEFPSAEIVKKAMCKDKMTIGSRYVELFPSTPDEARRAEARSRELKQ